jgi:outer membrane protein TolC
VAQTFFTILFFEKQQRILEDALKNTRDRLREMQARQAQGIARKTEVLLIETRSLPTRRSSTAERQALDLARNQMAFLWAGRSRSALQDDVIEPPVPVRSGPLIERASGNGAISASARPRSAPPRNRSRSSSASTIRRSTSSATTTRTGRTTRRSRRRSTGTRCSR